MHEERLKMRVKYDKNGCEMSLLSIDVSELPEFLPREGLEIMSQWCKRLCWTRIQTQPLARQHRMPNVWTWHKNRHRPAPQWYHQQLEYVLKVANRSVLLLASVELVSAKNYSKWSGVLENWMPAGHHPDYQGLCSFHWGAYEPLVPQ